MKKPDKNQTIYIDTSKTMNSIEINNDTSVIEDLIQNVKDMKD